MAKTAVVRVKYGLTWEELNNPIGVATEWRGRKTIR